MSRVRCICGNELSDVTCPSIYNGFLMTGYDAFERDEDDIIGDGVGAWECCDCGRLGIEVKRTNNIIWFKPESGKYEKVLDYNQRKRQRIKRG